MANSLIVSTPCTVTVPYYAPGSFTPGNVVQPTSPYYDALRWAGLATDSGQPGVPAPGPATLKAAIYTVDPADGQVLMWRASDGRWSPATPTDVGAATAAAQAAAVAAANSYTDALAASLPGAYAPIGSGIITGEVA